MVGGWLAFQQVHEVYVPPAGTFNLAGAEDMVHSRINKDGQHLPWRRQITIYPLIGLLQ